MKIKRTTIGFALLSVLLVIAIFITVYFIIGDKSREIKTAKNFIKTLQNVNAIDSTVKIENMEYKPLKAEGNNNPKIKYTIITENYGVDLDKDYNVIGFSKKEADISDKSILIEEEKAVELAERYIKSISNEEIKFKELRKLDVDMAQFYTVVFYKCKEGYPYYDYEVVAKINKITGELDGYSNATLEEIKHFSKINIESNKAKEIVYNYFSKLDCRASINSDPLIAYVKVKDNEIKLAYIFIADTKNKDGIIQKHKIFVSTDTGEVIGINSEGIDKPKVN
ncbi:hypothetical protein [Clostridium chauvoei]|uniref:Peptidase propeptide and YPEB domain protein n=2 Tax=Clostridium chauvoei TaxID=46867 RepID=A0A1U6JGT4_9CLOT|nr:hypothetical protein [Clostridium chauvoei]ATD55381.1 hypothetical protein BTM20_09065 [Clostridium chauvoei]ATD56948.1 hypothetical protein BTM21_03980 [Clostridium chauvoei]MBX7280791.1 hypothetical protein [Clostridium chauvoei]MBX7283275.1 hypothetical protein [Clostridium chauvoei]MBX7285841.1 hypothetical protein [Clostridium chauvoei]